jgi:hypothetical protein
MQLSTDTQMICKYTILLALKQAIFFPDEGGHSPKIKNWGHITGVKTIKNS